MGKNKNRQSRSEGDEVKQYEDGAVTGEGDGVTEDVPPILDGTLSVASQESILEGAPGVTSTKTTVPLTPPVSAESFADPVLVDLLTDIEINQAKVDLPQEDVDPRMRAGYAMTRQNARDILKLRLAQLESEVVPRRLVAVFATGSQEGLERAAELVRKGGVVVDAKASMRRLADVAEACVGRERADRAWSIAAYARACTELSELTIVAGLDGIEPPKYDFVEAVPDRAALEAQIQKNFGPHLDTLLAVAARREIVRQVREGQIAAPRIPVLVLGADSTARRTLEVLFSASGEVEIDEPPTKSALTLIFKQVGSSK